MFTDADNNLSTGALGGREAYFYHCNPRGDVYALSDELGVIIERYDYSLFGDTSVMDANFQLTDEDGNSVTTWQESKSIYGNPFQFSGGRLPEIFLHKKESFLFSKRRFDTVK